jgi:polyhydroxyalkanoate synthesis repressor PhaR
MTVMLNSAEKPATKEPVVVKKYANRRLYNTETSTYVTLDDLAAMVKAERDFVVYDAKSGDDLTHSVLTQIIVEQESNRGSDTMLPVPFLRQLIRFYGDSIEKMVPSYLQISLDSLTKDQDKFRKQFANVLTPAGAIEAYQEQARKNLALFEQAMGIFSPFKPLVTPAPPTSAPQSARPAGPAPGASPVHMAPQPAATVKAPEANPAPERPASNSNDQLAEMQKQMAAMQAMMEKIARERS